MTHQFEDQRKATPEALNGGYQGVAITSKTTEKSVSSQLHLHGFRPSEHEPRAHDAAPACSRMQ